MPLLIEREYLDEVSQTLQIDSILRTEEDEATIETSNRETTSDGQAKIQMKRPKKIIRCGDGYLEEYTTDEEEVEERKNVKLKEQEWNTLPYSTTPTYTLSWIQYANYHLFRNTRRTQWFFYAVGEFFADMFGITTPRHQAAIKQAYLEKQTQLEQENITEKCYIGPEGGLVEKRGTENIEMDFKGIGEHISSITTAEAGNGETQISETRTEPSKCTKTSESGPKLVSSGYANINLGYAGKNTTKFTKVDV